MYDSSTGPYVIRRADQGGGWVTPAGSPGSYTGKLQHARRFPTLEAAERERCTENEIVERFDRAH